MQVQKILEICLDSLSQKQVEKLVEDLFYFRLTEEGQNNIMLNILKNSLRVEEDLNQREEVIKSLQILIDKIVG